jgi:uncharacterized protein (DUF2267 family)
MEVREEPGEASRTSSAFIRDVERVLRGQRWAPKGDLPMLIRAVLHALMERLGGGERRRLVQLMPQLVPAMPGESPQSLGFEQLVERAASSSGAPQETVRLVIHAVFCGLRQLIPAELDRSIASTLPEDIFVVWNSANGDSGQRSPAAALTQLPSIPSELRLQHAAFDHVERNAQLPDGISGGAAFVATVCLTLLGTSGENAAFVRDLLPSPLRDLLFRCAQEREEEPTPFTAAEFSDALGAELGVTAERATQIAGAVFEGLALDLPAETARALAEHLPAAVRTLWPAAPAAHG